MFDYPDLVQADAKLAFPEYTGQAEAVVEDTRSVTAVEGTRLTLICRLNKPVADARLVPRPAKEEADPAPLMLAAEIDEPNVYTVAFDLTQSRRYRLHLQGRRGPANKQPPEFVVNVTPNQPPELEAGFALRKDVQVSPLEELAVKAEVWDDFGLRRYGVSYSMAGQAAARSRAGRERRRPPEAGRSQHLIAFESLKAEPDQLLSYYFWAEDSAADGTSRRTSGDMFFAEVRPFEEIFRQGEQPSADQQQQQQQQQQGSQNAQQAEELAELQKQIINATWKVIRREIAAKPTRPVRADVEAAAASRRPMHASRPRRWAKSCTDPRSKAVPAEQC